MAFNYKIDQGNGFYYVRESRTEQILGCFLKKDEARSFMKRLNLGAGFDGWTPSFMLKKFHDKANSTTRVV